MPTTGINKLEGAINVETGKIWEVYEENLRRPLSSDKTLFDEILKKTVVTSDQGTRIGEHAQSKTIREWGLRGTHIQGNSSEYLYTGELVRAPWFVGPYEMRKGILNNKANVAHREINANEFKNRLEQVGYA